MKLRGAEKTDLEKSIARAFPGYSFDANAPQGQNCFSVNYILSDSNNKCLLKILLKKKIKGNVNQSQSAAEVSACQSVNSPYVISLLETKHDNNYIFLKFPYLAGSDLKAYKNGKILGEEEITNMGINILRGVSDLWRKKIVHQDIKPENIFVLDNGEVKILDFGSARFRVSPFRGMARTNFAYSSPEQILASRPGNIQANRITIDDRADVFAVGLIMYYLIESRHPFEDEEFPADAIYSGKIIPAFSRGDISEGLKRIVTQMLDINQLNRPHAQDAISHLESGNIVMPKLQNGGFYYCVINGINRFLTIKSEFPDLFDGVVVEASQVPNKLEEKNQIRNNVKTVLIDPQTYLFQAPKHQSKKFGKLPYFKHGVLFNDMPSLLNKITSNGAEIRCFVSDVINYQLEIGVSAVVPPFLYIKEFNDESWGIDQELTDLIVNDIIDGSFTKPIVKGVAISQEILTSDQTRRRLLEYLTSFSDKFEGYLVLLDSAHNEVVWEEPWLKGARDLFIKLLSTNM
jgi:serine/threonine protein kinase